ncbi:MAG: type III-A CRISPR-associated RAMP protein Csm5 [Rhodovarius sp.]|nr:type III-A CRISPR-associated RAMP protein Csm5 [Rhodovarius sp.]
MNVYAGPPRALTRTTLRLVPLTPIHIGDGTDMRLDEYLLEGDDLCRFDPMQALRAMSVAQRQAFQRALDAGNLAEAGRKLREAGRACILERVPLTKRSREELDQALRNPTARSGQVKPFIRSGGRPYIPGSSIKGAFRTALASAALPRDKLADDRWTHETALREAFGLDPQRTETDPLRFLHVSDAFLPQDATLIDKAEVVKPGGRPATSPGGHGGIQMHYESTYSLIDGEDAPAFEVRLDIDERALSPAILARREAGFDAHSALARLRAFHVAVFNAETKRFFEDNSKKTLLRTLLSHSSPDGRPPLNGNAWDPHFVLLRLGRFGHFESKSLEGVRRGVEEAQPKKEKPRRIRAPNEWGRTRTVVRDAKGNPIPFGWVIGWVVKEERV